MINSVLIDCEVLGFSSSELNVHIRALVRHTEPSGIVLNICGERKDRAEQSGFCEVRKAMPEAERSWDTVSKVKVTGDCLKHFNRTEDGCLNCQVFGQMRVVEVYATGAV